MREYLKKVCKRLLTKEEERRLEDGIAAALAEEITNNVAYQQAREDILMDIMARWILTKPDEVQVRERLYYEACAAGQLETQLQMYIAQGINQ